MNILGKVLFILVFCVVAAGWPVYAQEDPTVVETVYNDTYTVTSTNSVQVEREITITNTTAKLFVSEYALSFTNADNMRALKVLEDGNEVEFNRERLSDGTLVVRVVFKEPAVGKGTAKKLTISYISSDFLKKKGKLHELFIPISSSSTSERLTSYAVTVKTPENFPELAIAKPPAKEVSPHVYQWSNAAAFQKKIFYLSFSPTVVYRVELHYAFNNSSPYEKVARVPFVPDGTYQKVYVENIQPKPERVEVDVDGNYLGTFAVPGNSVKTAVFTALVELTTSERTEIRDYIQAQIDKAGLGRYLTQEAYWTLEEDNLALFNPETVTVRSIMDFVVDKLSYDHSRIDGNLKRMGANWALQNPQKAVCMEYTDLFIALSREQGIASREVVGYAITDDESLQPLSFFGDVLHAWPEYYDNARQRWQPVDPTWEDTSKLDYFSSFDLNHIALVYHGKDTTYPLPPGVYKVREDKKDVLVTPLDTTPSTVAQVQVLLPEKIRLSAGRKNKIKLTLESSSNVFLYDVDVKISSTKDKALRSTYNVPILAPYEVKTIELALNNSLRSQDGVVVVKVNGATAAEAAYTVAGWQQMSLSWGVIGGVIVFIGLFIVVKLFH